MSTQALPNRRTVLRGSAALIASVAMFAPLRDLPRADAATPYAQPSAPPTTSDPNLARAPQRRSVPVGLL